LIGLLLAATCVCNQQAGVLADVEQAPPQTAAVREYASTAERIIHSGLEFLIATQTQKGTWGSPQDPMIYDRFWSNPETHRAWQYAVTSLVCISLMQVEDNPRAASALNAGLDFVVNAPPILRVSDWDTDNTWAYVYGLAALTQAAQIEQLCADGKGVGIGVRGRILLQQLCAYQSPNGGWGYYDDEATTSPPQWGTSFMTGVVVLALLDAQKLGWEIDSKVIPAAVAALNRCRLPDGSYTYSVNAIPTLSTGTGINRVRGSLSRMQVCNLALYRAAAAGYAAEMSTEQLRQGLGLLFQEHHYLDIARGRPNPHEAYHLNSGYFYLFGHYYAGQVLAELDAAAVQRYYGALVLEVAKTQATDGSMIDFFMNDYGRPYGAAFGIGALLEAKKSLKR
jgi:hypothetical protein